MDPWVCNSAAIPTSHSIISHEYDRYRACGTLYYFANHSVQPIETQAEVR